MTIFDYLINEVHINDNTTLAETTIFSNKIKFKDTKDEETFLQQVVDLYDNNQYIY